MARIINLTPHTLNLLLPFRQEMVIPPSGNVARVSAAPSCRGDRDGLPVPVFPAPVWGEVEGLPAPQPKTVYIVSSLVLSRCAGRTDVFAPATGPNQGARREDGRITGVSALVAAPPR